MGVSFFFEGIFLGLRAGLRTSIFGGPPQKRHTQMGFHWFREVYFQVDNQANDQPQEGYPQHRHAHFSSQMQSAPQSDKKRGLRDFKGSFLAVFS